MKQTHQIFFLFFLCFCVFFAHLDAAFPDLMEMRNFITAREMITEGNWWFTTLNLEPRLEKPPMPTWLTAWSVLAFGDFDNLYALRLPGAIVASLMVFFFYGFLKELNGQKYFPFIGGVVLATSILMIQQGRTNSWDIYTHAFLLGSLWQFMVGINRNKKSAIFFSMMLMGLSILSKGPVSLYALWIPFVIAYGLSYGNLKLHWNKLAFILIGGLVIGFSWNVYMYLFQPEATEYVLNKETTSWANKHVKSILFYLNFPIFIGIWLPFLVSFFLFKYAKGKLVSPAHYRFALIWLIAVIVLLSLVPTKKERYLLPAVIPMCLMVCHMIHGLYLNVKNKKLTHYDRILLNTSVYLISGAGVIVPFVLVLVYSNTITTGSKIGLVLILFISLFGFYEYKRRNYRRLFYLPVTIVCLLSLFVSQNLYQWSYNYDDFKNLAEVQQIEELKNLSFYTEDMTTDPKMIWLLGKPTSLASSIDFNREDQFPLVISSVNPIEVLYQKNQLENVTYTYYGEFDYFRTSAKWKANVYLVEWKK